MYDVEDVDHSHEDDRAVFALLASVLGLVLIATFAYFTFWVEPEVIAEAEMNGGTSVDLTARDNAASVSNP